jgi:hypothetical protein
MTPDEFRRIALSLPQTEEVDRRGQSKFRVSRHVFATLAGAGDSVATVHLTPDQQSDFMHAAPNAFTPVPGGWGRLGATQVHLPAATKALLQSALGSAWRNAAPPVLLRKVGQRPN